MATVSLKILLVVAAAAFVNVPIFSGYNVYIRIKRGKIKGCRRGVARNEDIAGSKLGCHSL
jgi:hypothetical protein